MKPHVERMIKEQVRLADKITRLSVFISSNSIFQTLPQEEKSDMFLQLQAMQMYNTLLLSRICRARKSENTDDVQVTDEKYLEESDNDENNL